jgi:hypothetical protein
MKGIVILSVILLGMVVMFFVGRFPAMWFLFSLTVATFNGILIGRRGCKDFIIMEKIV